jgi:hypothetical protein
MLTTNGRPATVGLMEARDEAWAIVIAGFWNRMIFSPTWVSEHLFPGAAEIERMVLLMPDAPLVYRNADLDLEVSNARLSIKPRRATADCLEIAAGMARVICRLLPNTPVVGAGINFGFEEALPEPELLELFNAADVAELAGDGWQVESRVLRRELSRDDRTLNLSLTFKDRGVVIDANFHRDARTAEAAGAGLQAGHVQESHDMLIALLQNAYGLERVAGGANV